MCFYLPNNARLLDFVKRAPANTHSLLFELHFVQMFANATVLRTPSGGVLRNFQCNTNTMVTFKTLLKAHNAHPTHVNKVHYYLGKKDTSSLNRGSIAHYAVQSWELYMMKYRDVNLGKLFDNSSCSIDTPNQE
jgi:hypothetical protein